MKETQLKCALIIIFFWDVTSCSIVAGHHYLPPSHLHWRGKILPSATT